MSDPVYEHIGEPETLVIEECSELIKALCKVKRFGWYNHNPYKDIHKTNMDHVKEEIADVIKAINKLNVKMNEIETKFNESKKDVENVKN